MTQEPYGMTPLRGRWTRRPTRRGVATAVLGALLLGAGVLWRYPGVLALGVALLALPAVAFVTVLGPAPILVQRAVWPLEVTRFEACLGRLRVQRARRLFGAVPDAREHVDGQPQPVRLPRLAPGASTEIEYPIPTRRRGVLAVGPFVPVRRAVAGLAESRASLGGIVRVRVLPRVLPVRGLPTGIRRGQVGADERVERGGTDLVALREYVPGDDLRRLHWATSARVGALMVREDADPATAYLAVLLDDRTGSYLAGNMEDAVEVAASLAVAAAENEHGVRLLSVSGQLDLAVVAAPGADTAVAARDLASALADVTARDVDAGPPPVPVSARDVVVAVTGSEAALDPLIAEAGRAVVGVVMVDVAGQRGTSVVTDPVTVLRAPGSEQLLALWDAVVAG